MVLQNTRGSTQGRDAVCLQGLRTRVRQLVRDEETSFETSYETGDQMRILSAHSKLREELEDAHDKRQREESRQVLGLRR